MSPSNKGIHRRSPNTSWLETLVQGACACKRLACEQALRGALAARREEEEALSTTCLEFEYLRGKSRCEMMISEDDISNDVITLGTCRVNVCLHWRLRLPRADWRKSDSPVDGERAGNYWWRNSNSRDVVVTNGLCEHSRACERCESFGSTSRDKKFALHAASSEHFLYFPLAAIHTEILFFKIKQKIF